MRSRTLLRWLLLAQLLAAAAIAWALVRFGATPSWWLAALAGAAAVLVVRLLITANNFALSARFASQTPDDFRLKGGARLRLFGEEFIATMLNSSWFMARTVSCERIHPGSAHPPVLLLHGYGCNAGYWTQLARRLDAAGISHAALDLEPILAGIDDYVPLVERAVATLRGHSGAGQVIVVAHSMGGLVARAYLRAHGGEGIAHVFTLGTPHHGTSLAGFGPGKNAAQMRWSAALPEGATPSWLQALGGAETPATRALITSIYTHHDNIVSPQTSSVLPGAQHIAFGGVGHVAMGSNPRILDRLMQEINSVVTR